MTEEATTTDPPRLYVASLSDYNAGHLHGAWIDMTDDLDAIREQIAAMLAASPEAARTRQPAEEYAIHDHDGWLGLAVGEYDSLDRLHALAALLAEHGAPLAAFIENDPSLDTDEIASAFEEAYAGEHDSPADFAYDLATDTAGTREEAEYLDGSRWPFSCIDWERAAKELRMGGDYWYEHTGRGTVYVYRAL